MPRIGGNQPNAQRDPTDLYPTPEHWTEALLSQVKLRGPVWECAAGNHDMVRVLCRHGYQVNATDILAGTDFLAQDQPWAGSIVTNPPYSLASQFVDKALELAAEQTAMLLPVGALGGQRRYRQLWSQRPPSLVLIIATRMPMNGQASQFNHCWVVWDRRYKRPTSLRWAL